MEKQGIVLYASHTKRLVTLLSPTEGKQIFFYQSYISIGSFIYYSTKKGIGGNHLVVQELCAIPIFLASSDIVFLHSVLGLYNFTIPLGAVAHTGYDFLFLLYSFFNSHKSDFYKNIFLVKILMLFGLYTTRLTLCTDCMGYIYNMSVDTFWISDLNLDCLDLLEQWIHCSFEEHIQMDKFYGYKHYGTL